MRTLRKNVPMVEPADFTDATKYKYQCDGKEYSFAQLCTKFHLKYMSVWWKVAKNGMTVEQAIKTCIKEPNAWGPTYSSGTTAIMDEKERAERRKIRDEKWKETMSKKRGK